MATFLELAQDVAAESGTVTGVIAQPLTVVGQTGRLGLIVGWTAEAYSALQTHRPSWQWMQGEFETALTIGQQRYTTADLSLTRPAGFTARDCLVSIYDNDIGTSDEGSIEIMDWDAFYVRCLVGGVRSQTGKPQIASIDPSGKIALWPTPDKAYMIHGMYRKAPQTLAADADEPEMPARFHPLIKWRALIYLAQYDESMNQFPLWNMEYRRMLNELEHDQLPKISASMGTFA